MANLLFLFPEKDLSIKDASSLIISDKAEIIEPCQIRTITQLQKLKQKNELVIILPSSVITAHLIKLPTLKKAKLMVPHIIEEELISDIDNIHFTLQNKMLNNGLYLVYTINKTLLDDFLSNLSMVNLNPKSISAELVYQLENHLLIGPKNLQIINNTSIGTITENMLSAVNKSVFNNLKTFTFINSNSNLTSFIQNNTPSEIINLKLTSYSKEVVDIVNSEYIFEKLGKIKK